MSSNEVHYASITEVAERIRAGALSPVDLTESMLDRIAAIDPALKSYATVTADRAREAARHAAAEISSGRYRGPLHGIPVAVKDLCYTKGIPTMGGLAVRRDFVPDYDGTAVVRLEAAGAVLLGKIALTEGAMAGYNPTFDIPVNPWREDYWSGASSSGSGVSVAAGLCFAALGTDTGGSIRFPAMANGVVGFKPTYGLVSRHGVLSLADSMDHVGPLTRSVQDAAIVLEALAGHDPEDPTSLEAPVADMCGELDDGVAGLRIGVDREFVAGGAEPGLVAAIEDALATLEGLGAEIVDVVMPDGANDLREPWFAICSSEAARAHAQHYPSRADEYGPYFGGFLAFGHTVTEEQLAAARAFRTRFSGDFDAVLASVDAVVMPAAGQPFANPCDLYGDPDDLQPLFEVAQMQYTIPADLSGTPSLVVRCGVSESGIPYTLQFAGPRLSEPRLVRIGHAYERATDWHHLHPPL
jgi:amidase